MAKKKKPDTPDRFRKLSPKLVLEEQITPVGCGGFVLRWRDPLQALPVEMHLYHRGKSSLFIDGEGLDESPRRLAFRRGEGMDIAPGPHQIAFTLDDADLSGGLFMFAVAHLDQRGKTLPAGMREEPWAFVSSIHDGWRALTEPPIEHGTPWTAADFDDSAWTPLTRAVTPPAVDWRNDRENAFALHRCRAHDAAFLALPPGTTGRGRVWVRVRMTVPMPTIS